MRTAVVTLAALLVVTPARAQAPPQVDAALATMEGRAEPGQRWAFTRTVTNGGASFTAAFDPSRPDGAMWRLITPASQDELPRMLRRLYRDLSDEDDTDFDVVLGADPEKADEEVRAQIGAPFQLLSENDAQAVFAFAPQGALIGESSEEEPPGFMRHLAGELIVDKAAPIISELRAFATRSFKPLAIARINEMEIVTRYAEVEPGGPVAIVSLDARVVGSALFVGVDQTVLMENSGFARVGGSSRGPQPAE